MDQKPLPPPGYYPTPQASFIELGPHVKMSSSIKEIGKALSQVQNVMRNAEKSSINPHFKSKYADLTEIIDVAKKPLSQVGLSFTQLPSSHAGIVSVTTMLMHVSGEWISVDTRMKAKDEFAQSVGSAITYAKRYALAAMLGIAAEEDDDGHAATGPAPSARPPQLSYQQKAPPAHEPPRGSMPGAYIIDFGKYKGQPLSAIKPDDLINYVKFLQKTSHESGKPMNQSVVRFIEEVNNHFNAYMPSATPELDELPPVEPPF